MKQITNRCWTTGTNAWGQDSGCYRQVFEVEAHDVGVNRPHYRGFNHEYYTFTTNDVGKKIEVLTYREDGTTSWSFERTNLVRGASPPG